MTTKNPSLLEIFLTSLRLGCISFGGPVAHLGYFKEEFVSRRQWLTEERFAELLGLCQFIPGPASSQLNFAIGRERGGLAGGCSAWLGFTLQSAVLMIGFAYGLVAFGEEAAAFLDGLLVAAVAVVAKAVHGLATKLCPDVPRLALALGATGIVVVVPGSSIQVLSILIGGAVGLLAFRSKVDRAKSVETVEASGGLSRAMPPILMFVSLLAISFAVSPGSPVGIFAEHYRAGALVFGGGHVVLPLLEDGVVGNGLVAEGQFLAGYSAAQVLPGPLFTFSAFLGSVGSSFGPAWLGGVLALLAIFLPGMLLLLGLLPVWGRVRGNLRAQAALTGANAAVVGLLIAALIDPVWPSGIQSWADFGLAVAAFFALQRFKLPPWVVVPACGLIGWWLP